MRSPLLEYLSSPYLVTVNGALEHLDVVLLEECHVLRLVLLMTQISESLQNPKLSFNGSFPLGGCLPINAEDLARTERT